MHKAKKLFEIGSKVFVDLDRVQDGISPILITLLKKDPYGKVLDYKLTDGQEIGFILELNNGSNSWFFSNEIKACEEEINSNSITKFQSFHQIDFQKSTNFNKRTTRSRIVSKKPLVGMKIVELLNPINFSRWLIYSLKDVF